MSIKKIINPKNNDFVILVDNGGKIPSILTKSYFDNLVKMPSQKKTTTKYSDIKDNALYYEKKLLFYKSKLKEKQNRITLLTQKLNSLERKNQLERVKLTNIISGIIILTALFIIFYLGWTLVIPNA